MYTEGQQEIHIRMVTAALFILTQKLETNQMPSTEEWINSGTFIQCSITEQTNYKYTHNLNDS